MLRVMDKNLKLHSIHIQAIMADLIEGLYMQYYTASQGRFDIDGDNEDPDKTACSNLEGLRAAHIANKSLFIANTTDLQHRRSHALVGEREGVHTKQGGHAIHPL
jgi:hypothetical protein